MAVNGKGRPTKEQAAKAKLVDCWLAHITSYEKVYKPWEVRAEKICKRYRDDDRTKTDGASSQAKFNVLWANVQTLVPATYSRIPKPDVSRRFKDNDPVARVGAMIVERSLEFEVQHYEDFRNTMRACVLDRFLGGRGTSWARYEPHVRALPGEPVDGDQVTEDADEPNEELDYECAPVDYVHWKDFGHTLARTWDEVRAVWRRVYMTKAALEARFGADWAKKIPLDAQPEDYDRKETSGEGEDLNRACIYEIWDKETGCAYWLSKSLKTMVDEKDDPLGLEDFFPCPKPLYASLTNESLVPVPDFALYQDQARQLDTLADRLEGLIQALQVKGVYDASIPEIARIFTEGLNGTLIPVKNWQAFAEKNGLEGAIDIVDLKNIYEALRACYEAIQQCLKIIYDITGLADIVRGQSEASETATAQQIKGQYASLRLNHMKQDVAIFATQLFQLKAQIYCAKFAPETLLKMAGVTELSPEDQAIVPQAMALLLGERATNPDAEESPNPLRIFRIEVNADTMVQIDEDTEKQRRMEFLGAVGQFFDSATKIVQQAGPMGPALVPLTMALLKYGVTGFKVGRQIEGIIDSTADKLAEMAKNPPPPPPNPEMLKIQAQQQTDAAKLQADQASEAAKHQREREAVAADMQLEREKAAITADIEKHKAEVQAQIDAQKMAVQERTDAMKAARDQDTELRKVALQVAGQIEVAKINAGAKAAADAVNAANDAKKIEGEQKVAEKQAKQAADEGTDARKIMQELLGKHEELLKTLAAPVKIERDSDGKMTSLTRVK
jgi:hypothetical protein